MLSADVSYLFAHSFLSGEREATTSNLSTETYQWNTQKLSYYFIYLLFIHQSSLGYLRPNLEYTVWYRLTESPEWRTLRIMQKNIMEATIQNLQPGREYEFMVLSQDKYGDGMFSKTIRFSTQGEFATQIFLQSL